MHQLVGVGDAVETHRLREDRPHLALGHQLVRLHALVGVGEVGADDLLLAHPQVADVEVELEARGGAADDDFAERLDDVDRGREGGPPDVLEDDVGGVAEDSLQLLGELPRGAEALLVGGRVGEVGVVAHHLAEFVAVDVVDGAELLDQLALLVGGDDADRVGAGRLAELDREDSETAGGAPDEDVVAGLQLALVHQHPVGGEVGQPVGGGLLPGERTRLGDQLLGLDLAEPPRLLEPRPLLVG